MGENEYFKLPAAQKMAILLVSLGSHTASKIVRLLTPEEVKSLSLWIRKNQEVNPALVIQSVKEFYSFLGEVEGKTSLDGDRYLQELFSYAFDDKRPTRGFGTAVKSAPAVDLSIEEVLEAVSLQDLTGFLSKEPVESLAIMLYNLEDKRANEIFGNLPREKQVEVINALAIIENMDDESQRNILETSAEVFKKSGKTKKPLKNSFLSKSAELLSSLPPQDMKAILSEIERSNSLLACQIRNQCFIQTELVKAPESLIRILVENIEPADLLLALRDTPDEIKGNFFRFLPEKKLEQASKALDELGPITPFIVETAQRKLSRIIQEVQGVAP